jgi:hypothetical protein
MADIVNLRQARKAKAKAEREERATGNRARFGRSKAERRKEIAERDRTERLIAGHLRKPVDTDPAGS